MQHRPAILYRRVRRTPELDRSLRSAMEDLASFGVHLRNGRLFLERTGDAEEGPGTLRVRLEITIPPGYPIVITRTVQDRRGEDAEAAARRCLGTARSSLARLAQVLERRGRLRRETVRTAEVTRLWPETETGEVRAPDGETLAFEGRHLARTRFADLRVGAVVELRESMGRCGRCMGSLRLIEAGG